VSNKENKRKEDLFHSDFFFLLRALLLIEVQILFIIMLKIPKLDHRRVVQVYTEETIRSEV